MNGAELVRKCLVGNERAGVGERVGHDLPESPVAQKRSAAYRAVALQAWRPAAIVNVGIAGSFTDDLLIGDVIVPRQVDAYDETAGITTGSVEALTTGRAST